MSDARSVRFTWHGVRVTALVCLLMRATPTGAQSARDMDARVAAMRDTVKATQALMAASRSGLRFTINDSLVADGVTVRFPGTVITERDRAALRDGIANARGSLRARAGAGAERLLDGDLWSISVGGMMRWNGTEYASFNDGREEGRSGGRSYALPLDAERIEEYMLQRAGTQLLRRDSTLSAFASGNFVFASDRRPLHVALVQLATSKSSVAQRCAEGSVRACRTILDPGQADQWYLPTDTLRGNGRPIPRGVAGSVVMVALEIGGLRAIEAIGAPHDLAEPVAILAQAAGVTPDSLLTVWGTRMREESVSLARPSIPFTAAAVAWWGIFLLVATRRRPR